MNLRRGEPDSPHWWMRPLGVEDLEGLIRTVESAHENGRNLACCTMNQIRIALSELMDRKKNPNNVRKDNGQLLCGCWGESCGGHGLTNIGESS